MSSVQAVIAALNQQSTNNELRQTSNRQSKSGPDITSLRNRFGSSSIVNSADTPKHRSSHIEQRSVKERTSSLNRSVSSISTCKKDITTSKKSDQLVTSSSDKSNYAKTNHQSLVEKLEKMTMERDQLKQQLHDQTINTPYSSACGSPNMEIPTSPLAYPLLFGMNEIDIDNENDSQSDYDDIITNYNYQLATEVQQKRQISNLQRQLAACEIGTQWMMNKYLGELERERLCTKSLGSIIQNQEDLIKAMENNNNYTRRPSSLPAPSSTGKTVNQQQYQQQQTLLLQSQLELQRLELDDKQEIITLLTNERDTLVKKMKQLTHMQSQHIEGEKCQPRHARLASMPSSGSLSSYATTISSATSSCLDWVTVNSMQSHHQVTPTLLSSNTKYLNKSYTPPQTPPPRESLPPLPTSTSSTTTPDLSPRSTLLLSPSPHTPGTPPSESQIVLSSSSTTDASGYEKSLGHKTSMPDIRTLHEHHIHHHHHHRYDSYGGGMENGITRQRSFWKGWKQRLTTTN